MSITPVLTDTDDHSDEDTLAPVVPLSRDPAFRALLRAPETGLIRRDGRLTRDAGRHISAGASVADAVIEDRG